MLIPPNVIFLHGINSYCQGKSCILTDSPIDGQTDQNLLLLNFKLLVILKLLKEYYHHDKKYLVFTIISISFVCFNLFVFVLCFRYS